MDKIESASRCRDSRTAYAETKALGKILKDEGMPKQALVDDANKHIQKLSEHFHQVQMYHVA